jgi:O-antigen ligase
MSFIEVVLVLALAAVLVVLVAGLFGVANPSYASDERRNRLMRLRVIAQAVAVGLLAVLVYLTR